MKRLLALLLPVLCAGQSISGSFAAAWNNDRAGKVVFLGDSLTAGFGLTTPLTQSYPNQTLTLLNADTFSYTIYNKGINGQTAATIDTNFASQLASTGPLGRVQNVIEVLAGINDLFAGTTAAAAYVSLQSIWSKARAAGYKVVAVTLTPANTVTPDSLRTSLNTLILSNAALYDAVADIGADATVGCAGCQNNATYYQGDGVHWTTAGAAIVAGLAKPAVEAVR